MEGAKKMSLRERVLEHIQYNGPKTVDELESELHADRSFLRSVVNDLWESDAIQGLPDDKIGVAGA